jgi:hypothetical protein
MFKIEAYCYALLGEIFVKILDFILLPDFSAMLLMKFSKDVKNLLALY